MTEKKNKQEEKKLLDLTTEEAMDFLFPTEVVDQLKHVAHEKDKQEVKPDSAHRNTTG